ncbi:hypothetical protein YC2023_113774 [Brassica napus]
MAERNCSMEVTCTRSISVATSSLKQLSCVGCEVLISRDCPEFYRRMKAHKGTWPQSSNNSTFGASKFFSHHHRLQLHKTYILGKPYTGAKPRDREGVHRHP